MTLEDKLLDRLEKLAGRCNQLAKLADDTHLDLLRTRDERDNLQIRYNQVCAAHDQLVDRCNALEGKRNKRKGKQ